jgi:hypothetical protein
MGEFPLGKIAPTEKNSAYWAVPTAKRLSFPESGFSCSAFISGLSVFMRGWSVATFSFDFFSRSGGDSGFGLTAATFRFSVSGFCFYATGFYYYDAQSTVVRLG